MRTILCFLALIAPAALASGWSEPHISILVDGVARPEYAHRGTTYVEALHGRDYVIRLSNPTPHRVAVALSVDGLNTIDAKHTTPLRASKWVLDPWETTDIAGWQVSDRAARRFYFTDETDSYGARIGKTQNLGVIAAVFFRERVPRSVDVYAPREESRQRDASPPSASAPQKESSAGLDDDYAATGMGGRTRHDVYRVNVDLDPNPIASFSIRYEFREQLVKLGVIDRHPHPLDRRERARGFAYCPE
jgi:hypothetical protein